jgi:hypothetical protein
MPFRIRVKPGLDPCADLFNLHLHCQRWRMLECVKVERNIFCLKTHFAIYCVVKNTKLAFELLIRRRS